MAQDDKIIHEEIHDETPHDAPPSYTPKAIPQTPIHPPPRSTSLPPASDPVSVPERVHVPKPPFSTDLTQLGPDPGNVICPRCHYGVRTSVKSSVGVNAGFVLKFQSS